MKNINRNVIVERANAILLNTADKLVEYRQGVITVTEAVLMSGNSYKGFGYLSDEDMKKSQYGHSVGINLWPEGKLSDRFIYTSQFATVEEAMEARFGSTDRTRIFFY